MRLQPIILLAALFLTSCTPAASPQKDMEFTRVPNPFPPDVQQWAEDNKLSHHATEKVFQDKRYILVSYGKKSTGGYKIFIENVIVSDDIITVTVRHSDPAPGAIVTQALTFPQDLVWIENLDLPIEYVATGDQSSIKKE